MSEPNGQPTATCRPRPASAAPPPAALSPAQERLWALDQLEPGNPLWNIGRAQRLVGRLDPDALTGALADLVADVPLLRSRIVAADGRPALVIDIQGRAHLERVDLAGSPADTRAAAAKRHAGWDVRRPFDMAGGPLARWTLLRLAEHDHILLLCAHGILVDGDAPRRSVIGSWHGTAARRGAGARRGRDADRRLARCAVARTGAAGVVMPRPVARPYPQPRCRAIAGGECRPAGGLRPWRPPARPPR
ncbi:MAG: condensation domain-containing protein [Anaerolineae bacterium]